MDLLFYSQRYENYKDLPHYTGNKFKDELMKNAKKLAAPGTGILASDESTGTIGNRFNQINVENTRENRIAYREMLFTTPGLEKYISGAIIYDETARDNASDGRSLLKVLDDKGILIGMKVDTGMVIIEGTNDESATQGLDGLGKRCQEYYGMGVRFAKWRAVIKIGDGCPSDVAIKETAHSLARYGNICQHNGIVPIIEPEILTDGKHDIKDCARVSERVFNAVMSELIAQGLLLEGLILKPNMILPGAQSGTKCTPEEIAFYTVRTLSRTITPAVPGITFLSGGQSEEDASLNLNAINALAEVKHPWNMSFSFGRALQSTVL
jgi:fructose-bisphosphate aldolase class I